MTLNADAVSTSCIANRDMQLARTQVFVHCLSERHVIVIVCDDTNVGKPLVAKTH
jgi:hypothetical protein